jgi:hypothetical protein
VSDLLYHYQLAVGADNPLLECISYYHIAEHFFEEVFNEALSSTFALLTGESGKRVAKHGLSW